MVGRGRLKVAYNVEHPHSAHALIPPTSRSFSAF